VLATTKDNIGPPLVSKLWQPGCRQFCLTGASADPEDGRRLLVSLTRASEQPGEKRLPNWLRQTAVIAYSSTSSAPFVISPFPLEWIDQIVLVDPNQQKIVQLID
jgi:hypothetical protein